MRRRHPGLREFVETLAEDHPPLSLGAADLTLRDAAAVRRRYGRVFNYLARVELEVELNVLELRALMPDATDTDRFFFDDVWSPQELQHGILLDAVQHGFGMESAPVDLTGVAPRSRCWGRCRTCRACRVSSVCSTT